MSNRITLKGCSPEPLASYLKALALLRLVAEQREPAVKGWWENDLFHLESELDEEALVNFFLEEYRPTPIVAPWHGGSGFSEKDDVSGREALRASKSPRFGAYRETIETILSWPAIRATVGLSLGSMVEIIEIAARERQGQKQKDLLDTVKQVNDELQRASGLLATPNPLLLSVSDLERLASLPKQASQTEKARSQQIKALLKPVKMLRTRVEELGRTVGKEDLIRNCRNLLGDGVVDWLDASTAIIPDRKKPEFPPILGTGGNEGHLEYTNAFMRYLAMLFLSEKKSGMSQPLLRNSLFGEPTKGLIREAVGQHNPGRAGGYNQGHGIELKYFPMNPWDFVLTLEGAIAWASGV